MANRKSTPFLPAVFQTNTNKKFLSATFDQLISEPNLKNIYGYIGRKFAPTYKTGDSYISELTAERQNYQLEPSIVIKTNNEITFFSSYTDLLHKIENYGGIINDHDRLFNNEYYSFDTHISYDAFVNYNQYYWLADGPDAVDVYNSNVELTRDITVTKSSTGYKFTSNGTTLHTLTLARGGIYTFNVLQDTNFWIQSEPGIDGKLNIASTISSRDVFGVDNNGTTNGVITFTVPQIDAQNTYTNMLPLGTVDYALSTAYSKLNGKTLAEIDLHTPELSVIARQLANKTVIFVNHELSNSTAGEDPFAFYGESAWTTGSIVVPEAQRYGIWNVKHTITGSTTTITLDFNRVVNLHQSVSVKYGLETANKKFYKDYDGFFKEMPLITSTLDALYYQDGTNPGQYGKIKIVNASDTKIDITTDILEQTEYTSPNGVAFTNGLKVRFNTNVVQTEYADNTYYVSGVGKSIRLIDETLLVTPETYIDEIKAAYTTVNITLSNPVTELLYGGSILYSGTTPIVIDDNVVKGASTFKTSSLAKPLNLGDIITGPGIAINTKINAITADTVFPEYVTIDRGSVDLNAWSRNNKWFHADVIKQTAIYNNAVPIYNQTLRAKRPIIQFNSDLQLFNYGRTGKRHIDLLDTTITDAFNELEGKQLTIAMGVTLHNGMRVVFANNTDITVRNKIYVVNLISTTIINEALHTYNQPQIRLVVAEDGNVEAYDTLVVNTAANKGKQWWFDGQVWKLSQQKTSTYQPPLFNIVDANNKNISEYDRSTFNGTTLFGYKISDTSTRLDTVLGIPLSYKNTGTQGEIEFQNFYDTETFSYGAGVNKTTADVSTGYIQSIINNTTTSLLNNWVKVTEKSKQYQYYSFNYTGNNQFNIDSAPKTEYTVPYIKVYVNNKLLPATDWVFDSAALSIRITSTSALTLANNDKVDIHVYGKTPNSAFYEVPLNLDLNTQNLDLTSITMGQVRNHLTTLGQNSKNLIGDANSANNFRDLDYTSQGGSILQHSAPLAYANLFLTDEENNYISATRFAQHEYTRFKNKFIETSATLDGVNPDDIIASVDLVLTDLNRIKNKTFPWYYSDMVPYGTIKTVVDNPGYTIFDPLVRTYEITSIFNPLELSNKAVLIYLNNKQLVLGRDYTFNADKPAVTILESVTLLVDDLLTIVEYTNTDGNYIPETPTKLGLYPKFVPVIYIDNTYREPISVLRGHDGSITPCYNDYRDQMLLELETRIYNNIKVDCAVDLYTVLPGKFRTTEYTNTEFNRILTSGFLNWIGNNRLDFAANTTFKNNDPFTWNYSGFVDRIDKEAMPGSWKACYKYYFDCETPNITPWEMLGFFDKPTWWENYYGEGPYTGGNRLMWEDLEAGRIQEGPRAGTDPRFARPGLTTFVPVDENGFLFSPAAILSNVYEPTNASTAWEVGQVGPAEAAWRRSSDYVYSLQIALALAKPAAYFGLYFNTSDYKRSSLLNQWLINGHHARQVDFKLNGTIENNAIVRSSGYVNWIVDYIVSRGVDATTVLKPLINTFDINLAYAVAGFTDPAYLQILAEQSSPNSTNDSIVVPPENYKVFVHKSPPIDNIEYSAVIIEKTNAGYTVRGYNTVNPYFTVLPSVINSRATKLTVNTMTASVFANYTSIPAYVPYGHEYKNPQQVVDFLISYQRHLELQGFTFDTIDEQLAEIKDWRLSAKEYLFWVQQGWKEGSIIVLSPLTNNIIGTTSGAIIDTIKDSLYGTKILDQNFNIIKNVDYTVTRTAVDYEINVTNKQIIGLLSINSVQYEHVIVFDNVTQFNDIIYKPELGSRQFRLKLAGQVTADWDGSLYAPGFVYNDGIVPEWKKGSDYLKGDLVQFKNTYFVAINNIIATSAFDYSLWKVVNKADIKKGLLPNLTTKATFATSYYDSYGKFKDNDQLTYSHGLIGFRSRQYLEDLGLSRTSQIELYKGYIKQKGTKNAINSLISYQFNNINSDITYYEEWALRVGEYGAVNNNQFIEFRLNERAHAINPAVTEFVTPSDTSDGITVLASSNLYRYSDKDRYNGNIALTRNANSNYDNDIPTAGYVNINDIDFTVFDLANYIELEAHIDSIDTTSIIWVAKDFARQWNVFRVSETGLHITTASNTLTGEIIFDTDNVHTFLVGDIVIIKDFSSLVNGVYIIDHVLNQTQFSVSTSKDLTALSVEAGAGLVFELNSVKFDYMETARSYVPKQGWKAGDKIWIDNDNVNSTGTGWGVYEKNMPWDYAQELIKQQSSYTSSSNFGHTVKISPDSNYTFIGSPLTSLFNANTGSVEIFSKTTNGEFKQRSELVPPLLNVHSFGYSITTTNNLLVIGAPLSNSGTGYVFVYKLVANNAWVLDAIITGHIANEKFGTTISIDSSGNWLYVGAKDKVYVYGLKDVKAESTIVATLGVVEITLPFSVESIDPEQLKITVSGIGMLIPVVDYTITAASTPTGATILLNTAISNNDITVHVRPYYKQIAVLTGDSGSNFGISLDASLDGTQVVVGAPNKTVNGLVDAGSVYVYDRTIEQFKTTSAKTYATVNPISPVSKVYLNGMLTTAYTVGTNSITLTATPTVGVNLLIETNSFKLSETIVGSAPSAMAKFGSSVVICSSNCAIYVGAPSYTSDHLYNTGAVFKFHNRTRLYGTNIGTVLNPTFAIGDSIRINYFNVISTGTTLNSLVADINNASILGVTASNENGYLRINSTSTVVKNKLTLSVGNNSNIYTQSGMSLFAQMQIITNPFNKQNEYFGTTIALSKSADMLVIASDVGTTKEYCIFDENTTTLDYKSTIISDMMPNSGAVYIYELYDDVRNTLEHPGRYAYSQQLHPSSINKNDQFGKSIALSGNTILVSAPLNDVHSLDAGAVYSFMNTTAERGWTRISSYADQIDHTSINRAYIYNKETNTIISNLDILDPVKGKILGVADQEISYKTEYDPAMYNRGYSADVVISDDISWGATQIGQVWWNLDTIRYINYEQGTNQYRATNWGDLFPGSTVEILEWVKSDVLPSAYVLAGYDGVPKYENDSAYVAIKHITSDSNQVGYTYYYWVSNKKNVTSKNRKMTTASIKLAIENPKGTGIPYLAIINKNAIATFNIDTKLVADKTVMHIDYETVKNDNVIHSEYELLQEGNAKSTIPSRIIDKLFDSLAGIDKIGQEVPDSTLSVTDKYGISTRPRQSMVINRSDALVNLITYCNTIFANNPIAKQYDLTGLKTEALPPDVSNFNTTVNNAEELAYLDKTLLQSGYKVLVTRISTETDLWAIYTLLDNIWHLTTVQPYKTTMFWDYVDWYATGYSELTKPNYIVETLNDAKKANYTAGTVVKVKNTGAGLWSIILIGTSYEFNIVGIQNGTIKIKDELASPVTVKLGFDGQGFDNIRYDQNPSIETRYILNAIRNDIFVGELASSFNSMFFIMVKYILSEQKYVDWIFKTRFITVSHKLRGLTQSASYNKDNQTYYENYINEVKPYTTKVREYLINYDSTDSFGGDITDFDLPAYYDSDIKMFRSPSGELTAKDEQLWATGYDNTQLINLGYTQWYNNRTNSIDSITVEDAGLGYTSEPTITIVGDGTGATAHAIINYDTGAVLEIVVDTGGNGYTKNITVIINGGNTKPARAYANIKNKLVRNINTSMKFDRISYDSSIKQWLPNTSYIAGDIVSYAGKGYRVNTNITTATGFMIEDYTLVNASEFNNANDRIMAYYTPKRGLPAKDLAQLLPGIDYPGVNVTGLPYDYQPGFDSPIGFDYDLYDALQYNEDGIPEISDYLVDTIINSKYTNATLGTNPEDINISGGAYIDTYSSHAPEELVPGIVFDTMSMQVFTKLNGNTSVAGYRIVSDLQHNELIYRIADYASSKLTANLHLTDSIMHVVDASKLPIPNKDLGRPGVVYINGECITYFKNYATELTPWQANISYSANSVVSFSNVNYITNTEFVVDTKPKDLITDAWYEIKQVGTTDFVHLGASANLVGELFKAINVDHTDTTTGIAMLRFNTFNVSNATVIPDINVIAEMRRGANGTGAPLLHSVNSLVVDSGLDQLVHGITTGTRVLTTDLVVGDVTIVANTSLRTSNVWLNSSNVGVTDGTGLNGALTNQALFIKDQLAANIAISYA